MSISVNGETIAGGRTAAFDGTLGTTVTNLRIGWNGSVSQPDACIKNARIFKAQLTNAQLLAMTS